MVMFTAGPVRYALAALLMFLPLMVSAQPDPGRQAFIELSASEDRLYVQQQLHLRVRLYYTNNVIQGHLQNPEHPDVVIEQLGEQKQYRELLDGESYRVVERNYALFPQKPGPLQLPPIEFQGTARHPRGHQYRISDSATLFPLEIQDIPASFSGSTWLPARSVEIHERGLDTTQPVTPGTNLTRTLTLTAEGLPATTLPDLEPAYPEALRAYPEPAQRQSSLTEERVVGQMQQTLALVPVPGHSGDVTLPEIRIPWWDVEEDREKIARLPARTVRLTGVAGPENAPGTAPGGEPLADSETPLPDERLGPPQTHWAWSILTALFALGWLTTSVAWWLQFRKKDRNPTRQDRNPLPGESREQARFAATCAQARALDPAFFSSLPVWASHLTGQPCPTVEAALVRLDHSGLRQGISQWQQSLFGPAATSAPQGPDLEAALKSARSDWQRRHRHSGKAPRLPDFYPQGISP